MGVFPITVRLPPELKVRFERYAEGLGLRGSELAKVLILREARMERLEALKNAGSVPKKPRQRRGHAVDPKTITARLQSEQQVRDFDAYAERCGLNRDNAAAWLLEKEIEERWFEKALRSTYPKHEPGSLKG